MTAVMLLFSTVVIIFDYLLGLYELWVLFLLFIKSFFCQNSNTCMNKTFNSKQRKTYVPLMKFLIFLPVNPDVSCFLYYRVKLVVTETFDAGLFGEHIVSTLIHAWNNLITTTPVCT